MAQALGIASGAAGLLSLGIRLCQGLLDYYSSWKDAESEVLTTYTSIGGLTKILMLINSTLEERKVGPEALAKVLDNITLCRDGITNLREKLHKIQLHTVADVVGERFRSQVWRVLYPFKKSTLVKLQEIVGELRDNLHLALSVLGMRAIPDMSSEVTVPALS